MTAQTTIIGTVASEPKIIRFESGAVKCSFRLAEHARKFDRQSGEWVDSPASWYTINTRGTLAEHTLTSIHKGQRIIATGSLRVKRWEGQDGKTGTSVELESDGIGHDLRFGTTEFVKVCGALNAAGDGQPENASDCLAETTAAVSAAGWHTPGQTEVRGENSDSAE